MKVSRLVARLALCSALSVAALAQTPAGGGTSGGGGGGYGGCPIPAPAPAMAPTPAPAPAPAPSPSPSPTPGGGTTPGGAPGGTTPGVGGSGGATPGPGGGGGPAGGRGGATGGFGRGGGPARGKTKVRISTEQAYWLGALDLPWDGTFLPKDAPEGYAAREVSVDEAAKGIGGDAAWRLAKKPTLVLVYDPSKKEHVKAHVTVTKDMAFRSASWFFNLKSVDVRSISEESTAKEFSKGMTYIVYRANGERVGVVTNPTAPGAVVDALSPAIEADFGFEASSAISLMGGVRARIAYLDQEIKRLELEVVTPEGERNEAAAKQRATFASEKRELEARVTVMSTVKPEALVTSAK